MRKTLLPFIAASLAAGATPAAAQVCEPLRVMTYNIRNATPTDGENRWEMRREQLIGQIELMRPDILGLQEALQVQRADLEKAMPSYEFLGVARGDGAEAGEFSNLALLRERFNVMASGTFWLSETPEKPSKGWDAAFPRIATWARLVRKADGRALLVLNTHLDHAGVLAREESAKLIGAFLAKERREGESVIMTGDFNSSPDTPVLATLTDGPAKLRDSRTDSLAPPLGPNGTFNHFQPLPETSNRIDFILHDPEWRTVRNTTLAMHGEQGRVASDHFPVIADLVEAQCVK